MALRVAIGQFPLNAGDSVADYLLYVNGKASGVVGSKRQGAPLTGVEPQSARHGDWADGARWSPPVTMGQLPKGHFGLASKTGGPWMGHKAKRQPRGRRFLIHRLFLFFENSGCGGKI